MSRFRYSSGVDDAVSTGLWVVEWQPGGGGAVTHESYGKAGLTKTIPLQ